MALCLFFWLCFVSFRFACNKNGIFNNFSNTRSYTIDLPPLIKLPIEPICQLSFTAGLDYSETAVFASSLRLTDASGNVYLGEAPHMGRRGSTRVDRFAMRGSTCFGLFFFAHKRTQNRRLNTFFATSFASFMCVGG